MEIGELVICLCPVGLLHYSVQVAEVQLKVAVVSIQQITLYITHKSLHFRDNKKNNISEDVTPSLLVLVQRFIVQEAKHMLYIWLF